MPIQILLSLLIGFSLNSFADSENDCDYNGTQTQMNICALNLYKVSDRKLNERYSFLMRGLENKDKKVLKTSQRRWLKQRDSFCKDRTKDSVGGSIHPLEWHMCLKSETDLRIETLNTWLESREIK